MQWVLDEKLVEDQQDWATKAGLSHGAVRAFMIRARKSDDASMKAPQLQALAEAARVSFTWLSTGDGAPTGQAEHAPFGLAVAMFLAGAADAPHAQAWLDSSAFRAPTATNARELLDALESSYARFVRAEAEAAAGGDVRAVGLALGGLGSRVEDAPDDEGAPRKLAPVKRKRSRQ